MLTFFWFHFIRFLAKRYSSPSSLCRLLFAPIPTFHVILLLRGKHHLLRLNLTYGCRNRQVVNRIVIVTTRNIVHLVPHIHQWRLLRLSRVHLLQLSLVLFILLAGALAVQVRPLCERTIAVGRSSVLLLPATSLVPPLLKQGELSSPSLLLELLEPESTLFLCQTPGGWQRLVSLALQDQTSVEVLLWSGELVEMARQLILRLLKILRYGHLRGFESRWWWHDIFQWCTSELELRSANLGQVDLAWLDHVLVVHERHVCCSDSIGTVEAASVELASNFEGNSLLKVLQVWKFNWLLLHLGVEVTDEASCKLFRRVVRIGEIPLKGVFQMKFTNFYIQAYVLHMLHTVGLGACGLGPNATTYIWSQLGLRKVRTYQRHHLGRATWCLSLDAWPGLVLWGSHRINSARRL